MSDVDFRNSRQILLIFFFATLIIAGEFALYSIRWIIAISLLGIGLGVIISPTFDFFHRKFKVPRALSVLIAVLLFVALLALLGLSLFDLLANQFTAVTEKLPELLDRATLKISDVFAKFPWIEQQLKMLGGQSSVREITERLQHGFKIGTTAVAGFIFVMVIAIYLAINPSYYFNLVESLIPEGYRTRISTILLEMAKNLRRWFSSQLIAMAMVGSFTTIALWAIGMDYWLLFGFLTGLLDIIPYIGPAIPFVGAIIVTLASTPEKVPWIIAAFIVIQQIESHIVIPNVMKYRMHFPPIPLMIMMLIMGKWFGMIGLLLTPGLFSIGMTFKSKKLWNLK